MNGYEELRHHLGFTHLPHLEEALVVDGDKIPINELLSIFELDVLATSILSENVPTIQE